MNTMRTRIAHLTAVSTVVLDLGALGAGRSLRQLQLLGRLRATDSVSFAAVDTPAPIAAVGAAA